MSDRPMTAAELAQARGEATLAPYLPALLDTIATLVTACSVNSSELVLVLPESEWAGVPAEERAVMVLGCQVIHADVPVPMVAVRARRTFGFEPVAANPPGSSVPWTGADVNSKQTRVDPATSVSAWLNACFPNMGQWKVERGVSRSDRGSTP